LLSCCIGVSQSSPSPERSGAWWLARPLVRCEERVGCGEPCVARREPRGLFPPAAKDHRAALAIINRLVDAGNTVIVIEHNLAIIKNADWIIDMGPEGGNKGGRVVFEGTPAELVKDKRSLTGQYLR